MNRKNRTLWILALITLTVVYFSYLANVGFPTELMEFSSLAHYLVDMFKGSPLYKVFAGFSKIYLIIYSWF